MKKWNQDIDMKKVPVGALVTYHGSLPYHGISVLLAHKDRGMVKIQTNWQQANGSTVEITCRLESISLMASIGYPETLCGGRSAFHWNEGIRHRWCLPWSDWTKMNYWEM